MPAAKTPGVLVRRALSTRAGRALVGLRGLKREAIAGLGVLDFITARENVVFLGPGTGRTCLAAGLVIGVATCSSSSPPPAANASNSLSS